MSDNNAVVAPQQQQPAPAEGQSGGGFPWKKLALGAVVYLAFNVGMNIAFQKQQYGIEIQHPTTGDTITVPANTDNIAPYALRPRKLAPDVKYQQMPKRIAPLWPMDAAVDLVVAVSETRVPTTIVEAEHIVLHEKKFKLGDYSDRRVVSTEITVPPAVKRNGTLWGHFYVARSGSAIDPASPQWHPETGFYFAWPLTQYVPKKKVSKVRNLLSDNKEEDGVEQLAEDHDDTKGPIVANYYHPNTSLAFVPDSGVMDFQMMHPAMRQFLHLEATGARDETGANTWYYPFLFVNSFWQLQSQLMELNSTVDRIPLHLDLGNIARWKFQIMSSIDANTRESRLRAAFGGPIPAGGDGTEIEMIKEVFIDTNPILLGVTIVVSIAHVILEMLAFGSDIAHYRKKKDNVGISVRTILANVFMQTIILLYLVDNSQNTSWVIFGSQAMGIVIELWKVTTVVDVRVRPAPAGSLMPWRVTMEDKYKLSETEERTKEYDEIAFRYMYMAGVPLLIAYAIYSLVYESHKSWYSYILAALVGSVYAYGFLMMVPALYINYRLKSVAHMPARAMMYKFLNTFIDDLFAFTIKMPFLHRLATFRDDVIFFVYLYQRYMYRIDYSRVNEFGQGGADEGNKQAVDGGGKPDEADAGAVKATGEDVAAATTGAEKKGGGGGAAKKRR